MKLFSLAQGWPVRFRRPERMTWAILLSALAMAAPVTQAATVPGLNLGVSTLFSFPTNIAPNSALIQASNGFFYGVSTLGGSNGKGSVYQFAVVSNNTVTGFTNLFSFGGTSGSSPQAPLIQWNDGRLYGTVAGTSGKIFRLTTDGTMTILASLTGNTPALNAPLTAVGSSLFGVTDGSGGNFGSIFQLHASGTPTNVVVFDGTGPIDPSCGLVAASSTVLYGASYYGGSSNLGSIFKLSLSTSTNTVSTVASFTGNNGSFPNNLILAADGNYYGTTVVGPNVVGNSGSLGTVFKMTSAGTLTIITNLISASGGSPNPGLVIGPDFAVYGTMQVGGTNGGGAVFRIATNSGSFSTVYSFGTSNGLNPQAGLAVGTDGNLYGTTSSGGTSNAGTIFQVTGFPPVIANQPVKVTSVVGATTNFSVKAFGAAPLSFQWFSGTNSLTDGGAVQTVAGSATANLTLTSILTNQAGAYSVVISNNYGTVTSAAVSLVVATDAAPPKVAITSPVAGLATDSALFTGTAADNAQVTNVIYWVSNFTSHAVWTNVAVLNATNPVNMTWSSDAITNLEAGTNKIFAQAVDFSGKVSSPVVTRQFIYVVKPAIQLPKPKSLTSPVGATASFRVTAIGKERTYQWMFNGNVLTDGGTISGVTTSNLTLTSITSLNAGAYSVVVSNKYGMATSSVATLTVVADIIPPSVKIALSLAGSRTNSWVITGTAGDNAQIKQVMVWSTNLYKGKATGLAAVPAVLNFTNPVNLTWYTTTALPPGTNTVYAQAMDFSGRLSPVVKSTFFYIVQSPLTLAVAGTGSGSIVGSVGSAALTNDTVPANNALLNIGEGYKVTVVPITNALATNSFFTNWTVVSSNLTGLVASNVATPSVSFTMEPGLSLTANFSTNLFNGMAGTYYGLFYDPNAIDPASSGMLSGLKMDKAGLFTGTIRLKGVSYAISGKFDHSGHITKTLVRSAANGGTVVVDLNLDWNDSPHRISGTVSNASWVVPLVAELSVPTRAVTNYTMLIPLYADPPPTPASTGSGDFYSGDIGVIVVINGSGSLPSVPAFPPGSSTTGSAGSSSTGAASLASLGSDRLPALDLRQALITPPPLSTNTNAPSSSFRGYGYALLTGSTNGTISISGALGDESTGASFSQNVTPSETGDIPLYSDYLYYSSTRGYQGVIQGWLHLSTNGPAGLVACFKTSTNAPYIGGYAGIVSVTGSPWVVPAKNHAAITLANGTLDVTGGALSAPLSFQVALPTNSNTFIKLAGSPTNSLDASIDPKTGKLTAKFNDGTKIVTGYGAILQNAPSGTTNGAGAFPGNPVSGSILLH